MFVIYYFKTCFNYLSFSDLTLVTLLITKLLQTEKYRIYILRANIRFHPAIPKQYP